MWIFIRTFTIQLGLFFFIERLYYKDTIFISYIKEKLTKTFIKMFRK